jgi:hypothetical protein
MVKSAFGANKALDVSPRPDHPFLKTPAGVCENRAPHLRLQAAAGELGAGVVALCGGHADRGEEVVHGVLAVRHGLSQGYGLERRKTELVCRGAYGVHDGLLCNGGARVNDLGWHGETQPRPYTTPTCKPVAFTG